MATDDFEILGENYRWYRATSEITDTRNQSRRPDSDYTAKVDVYEDRVRTWFLDLATRETRTGQSPGDYVALLIALAYLEGVQQYRCGDGSHSDSGKRFRASAERVFPSALGEPIDRLWHAVRNGLFHCGFTVGPTLVSHELPGSACGIWGAPSYQSGKVCRSCGP